MEKQIQNTRQFGIMLAAGFLALVSIRLFDFNGVYGVTTFLWILLFICAELQTETKKQSLILAIVLALGFVVRFFGLIGIPAVDIILLGVFALIISQIIILYCKFFAKSGRIIDTLAFPFMWMLVYIVIMQLRVPSIMRIDNMFFDLSLVAQSEAVISSYGISFLILWTISLCAFTLYNRRLAGALATMVIISTVLAYGAIRLNDAPEAQDSVRVAYTTGPYVGDFLVFEDITLEEAERSFDRAIDSAASQKAEILAFNEEAYAIKDSDEKEFLNFMCEKARADGIHVLVGLEIEDTDGSEGGKSFNRITWIDDKGEILDEYDKYQLIPLLEGNFVRGDGVIPTHTININGKDVNVSFAICYDSNFPSYVSQMSEDTDILILPSWDWKGVAEYHYRLCGTLSLEDHVTLLKPTYDGYTVATDPYGRIIKLSSTDETGYENVQVVNLPYNWG